MQSSALSFHWWRHQGQRWEELPQVPVGGAEEAELISDTQHRDLFAVPVCLGLPSLILGPTERETAEVAGTQAQHGV